MTKINNNISGVYIIKNSENKKVYVGSSTNLRNRYYTHFNCLKHNNHKNRYLQCDYNKYGKNNFEFLILEIIEIKKLLAREEYWTDYYNSSNRNKGYNITKIINGKFVSAKETVERLSISQKETFKNGRIPSFLGKTHSNKAKRIMSLKSSQKIVTKKFMNNLLTASNKACFKPVLQFDKNNNFIQEHESINKAVKNLFPKLSNKIINKTRKVLSIGLVCNKKRKTTFGFKWRFKDE